MEGKNQQFRIFENVIQSGQIFGIPHRNWGEAIIFTGCVVIGILMAPFTEIATLMGIIVFGFASFITFLRGYKNRSLTQILIAEAKFRKNKRVCHLRGPQYVRNKRVIISADMEGQSKASKMINNAKAKLIELAKENIEK